MFASGCQEELLEPRGELCIKKCATAPFCTSGWYGDGEARCQSQSADAAAGENNVPEILNMTDYEADVPKLIVNVDNFSTDPKYMWSRGNESCYSGLDDERECLPLEHRYEPLVFLHQRRNQSNLYYRFQTIQLGDKHCCCR